MIERKGDTMKKTKTQSVLVTGCDDADGGVELRVTRRDYNGISRITMSVVSEPKTAFEMVCYRLVKANDLIWSARSTTEAVHRYFTKNGVQVMPPTISGGDLDAN